MDVKAIKSFLFSDETKINLFSSNVRYKILIKLEEKLLSKNIISSVKYGGKSLMVWGLCILLRSLKLGLY